MSGRVPIQKIMDFQKNAKPSSLSIWQHGKVREKNRVESSWKIRNRYLLLHTKYNTFDDNHMVRISVVFVLLCELHRICIEEGKKKRRIGCVTVVEYRCVLGKNLAIA